MNRREFMAGASAAAVAASLPVVVASEVREYTREDLINALYALNPTVTSYWTYDVQTGLWTQWSSVA